MKVVSAKIFAINIRYSIYVHKLTAFAVSLLLYISHVALWTHVRLPPHRTTCFFFAWRRPIFFHLLFLSYWLLVAQSLNSCSCLSKAVKRNKDFVVTTKKVLLALNTPITEIMRNGSGNGNAYFSKTTLRCSVILHRCVVHVCWYGIKASGVRICVCARSYMCCGTRVKSVMQVSVQVVHVK